MTTAARFETLTAHVDRFTPDDRSDRPALGAIHGDSATLLVEGGASVAHLRSFVSELTARGRPPVTAIALTHWHWDHSFGSAAVRVPVIAYADSAAELELQAGYDWSDAALDARVADGRELAFCRDMIKVEIPDRSDLEIVVPTVIVNDRHTVDVGGVTAVIEHVGGDHAPDSCVVYVPEDRVLFLGDCLYQRLHAPEPLLTIAGVRALTEQAQPVRRGRRGRGPRRRRGRCRRVCRPAGRVAPRRGSGRGRRSRRGRRRRRRRRAG